MADRYRAVGDALVTALSTAKGDDAKEQAAVQTAIDEYMAIAGKGDPAEHGLAEYFCDDGTRTDPPPIERVPGATEDDISRWRNLIADLAGY